jgi:hypothetical protein
MDLWGHAFLVIDQVLQVLLHTLTSRRDDLTFPIPRSIQHFEKSLIIGKYYILLII